MWHLCYHHESNQKPIIHYTYHIFRWLNRITCNTNSLAINSIWQTPPINGNWIYWWCVDLPTQTPTTSVWSKLKWMFLMDKIFYHKAVMVYKSLNSLAPEYMWNMFKYVTDVNVRSTWNADKSKLYISCGKRLKMYTDNFSYSVGMKWNIIPSDIR